MAKRTQAVQSPVTPEAAKASSLAAAIEKAADRPVVNTSGVAAQAGSGKDGNKSPEAAQGKEWGIKVRIAEKAVHLIQVEAARMAAKLDQSGRQMFIEGFGSAWTHEATAKNRASEFGAIVRAIVNNPKQADIAIGDMERQTVTRAEFFKMIRTIAPATGQGARTDTATGAAGAGQSAQAVQDALAKAAEARQAKEVKQAQEAAKKRPDTAIKALEAVMPAATPAQQSAVVTSVLSAVTPSPDASVRLVRFIMQTGQSLLRVAADEATKQYANKVIADANAMIDRLEGASIPPMDKPAAAHAAAVAQGSVKRGRKVA